MRRLNIIILLIISIACFTKCSYEIDVDDRINHALLMGVWETTSITINGTTKPLTETDYNSPNFFRYDFKYDFGYKLLCAGFIDVNDTKKYVWGNWKDEDFTYTIDGCKIILQQTNGIEITYKVTTLNNANLVLKNGDTTITFQRIK